MVALYQTSLDLDWCLTEIIYEERYFNKLKKHVGRYCTQRETGTGNSRAEKWEPIFPDLKKGEPILRHDEEFEPILHQAETLTGTAQVKAKRGNEREKENKTYLVEVKLGNIKWSRW